MGRILSQSSAHPLCERHYVSVVLLAEAQAVKVLVLRVPGAALQARRDLAPVCILCLASPSMEEEASELSLPVLGAGGGAVRPGAGWAHVTLTQTDGKSGWKCSFCQKIFAGMNHTRVSSYI